MDKPICPQADAQIARKRRDLAPKPREAFRAFSASVFAGGAPKGVPAQPAHTRR